jgi:hypothetical protein
MLITINNYEVNIKEDIVAKYSKMLRALIEWGDKKLGIHEVSHLVKPHHIDYFFGFIYVADHQIVSQSRDQDTLDIVEYWDTNTESASLRALVFLLLCDYFCIDVGDIDSLGVVTKVFDNHWTEIMEYRTKRLPLINEGDVSSRIARLFGIVYRPSKYAAVLRLCDTIVLYCTDGRVYDIQIGGNMTQLYDIYFGKCKDVVESSVLSKFPIEKWITQDVIDEIKRYPCMDRYLTHYLVLSNIPDRTKILRKLLREVDRNIRNTYKAA